MDFNEQVEELIGKIEGNIYKTGYADLQLCHYQLGELTQLLTYHGN